ncbi:MAG: M23 family metallopeptidase [Flavobacteriales bacterium]
MARKKIKYIYNPDTLRYEPAKPKPREIVGRVLWILATGIVFGGVVILAGWRFLASPSEKKTARELEDMRVKYELLSKRTELNEKVLTDLRRRDQNLYRAIFEAEPLPETMGEIGAGPYVKFEGLSNNELITFSKERIDHLSSQIVAQSQSYDRLFQLAKQKEQLLRAIPAIMPVHVKDLTEIASGFGNRVHPVYKTQKFHAGIDFTAPTGTPIYATADGTVNTEPCGGGYGLCILLNHGFGYQTLYAHCSQILVKPGQQVSRGQLIGKVGSTGLSTGPHCHYEVHINGEAVDPVNFFISDVSPEEFSKILQISQNASKSFD